MATIRADPRAVRIGRDPRQCDLVIDDLSVSGLHCQIRRGPGVTYFILEDLGSTNGTWVRRKQVVPGEHGGVRFGDWLSLGATMHFVVKPEHLTKLEAPGEWVGPRPLLEPGGAPIQVTGDMPAAVATVPSGVAGVSAAAPVTIGRHSNNTIVRTDPGVAAFHCSVAKLPNGRWRVHDEGSISGTFLVGDNHRIDTTEVAADAELRIGGWQVKLSQLTQVMLEQKRRSKGTPLGDAEEVVLGRGTELESLQSTATGARLDLDGPLVSQRHAALRRSSAGGWTITDLGSSEGTYVNGRRIRGPARVTPEDLITLGGNRFRLDDGGRLRPEEEHGSPLTADRVTRELPQALRPLGRRTLIKDVSFAVRPGELVGILGPSGCGKTTLLRALCGEDTPSSGAVRLGEHDLHDNWGELASRVGYVPQDDIIHPLLTVRECLTYAARLRLPRDTTGAELEAQVDAVLRDLDLTGAADVLVGDENRKGISGGQRRRVNLALELLTTPDILFLDEPTSGLSSEDALQVVQLLRAIADSGRSVLVTIHQPSIEAYKLFDLALYMVYGEIAYFGPAFPGSILWFNPGVTAGPERDRLLADPGNALRPLSSPKTAPGWLGQWSASHNPTRRQFVAERMSRALDRAEQVEDDEIGKPPRRSILRQTLALTGRAARMRLRDHGGLALALVQAPIIAALILVALSEKLSGQADAWFQRLSAGPVALFLLVLAALWLGCQAGAREIVSERAILHRERRVGLRIVAYAVSKMAVLAVLGLVQCALLAAAALAGLSLTASAPALLGVLLLSQLTGAALGLLISAAARTGTQAASLVPICLLPQIILGGVIVPLPELPAPAAVVAQAMPARWALEAAMHLEHGDDTERRIQKECGITTCNPLPGARPTDLREEGLALCGGFCRSQAAGQRLTPLDRVMGGWGVSLSAAVAVLLAMCLALVALVPFTLGRARPF